VVSRLALLVAAQFLTLLRTENLILEKLLRGTVQKSAMLQHLVLN